MRPLWPDIPVIRERMLGAPASEDTAAEHDETIVDAEALQMPSFVAEQIQRLDEVRYGVRAPAVGDVVLISKPGHSPIAVCLEAPIARNADGARWRGWMVAAETDYATDKDVLFEESDGPCDPLAGMVETWNPLELMVPDAVRVLAHLSEYRMSVLREVARESHADTAEPPCPGSIANRETASGRLVLTGTPLGKTNDPRIEFREIYQSCAKMFAVATSPAKQTVARPAERDQAQAGFFSSLSAWLLGHRLAAGATAAVAVIGGVVVSQMLANAPTGAPTQMASVEAPKIGIPPSVPSETPSLPQEKKAGVLGTEPQPEKKPEKPAKSEKSKPQQPAPTQLANAPDDILRMRTLLVPLKDQAVVLAMRSGGGEQTDVKAYRIRLKPGAEIDRAIEVLMNLGFRIVKVEEGAAALQVMISEKQLTLEVEQKLQSTNLFDAAVNDRKQ